MEHVIARRDERRGAATSRSRAATPSSRATCSSLLEASERRARARGARGALDLDAHPAGPRRGAGAPRDRARRRAARRRRAAPQDRPAHRARERRRPLRSGHLRRVRPARDRGAAPAPHARRPDRAHARRRPGRRHRHRERRRCSASRAARCIADVVRLHRARRHAGRAEPPQEGPHVRARREAAAAGRVLHRGRRRAARATPTASASRASTAWRSTTSAGSRGLVPLVGITSGRCFAGNAALLGCCDVVIATRGLEHRHGRPGDDRGRRARRLPARGGRPDRRAGARTASSTSPSRDEAEAVRGRAQAYLSYFQGALATAGRARTSACCARSSPRTACASTTCGA